MPAHFASYLLLLRWSALWSRIRKSNRPNEIKSDEVVGMLWWYHFAMAAFAWRRIKSLKGGIIAHGMHAGHIELVIKTIILLAAAMARIVYS